MKKILLASVLAMSLLASCDKEDRDKEAPVLTLTRTNPVLTSEEVCGEIENNVIKVTQGSTFTVAFTVSDNFEVEEYKIDLHDNTDCHGHGRSPQQAGHWSISEIKEVDAQRMDVSKTYTVPADATPGAYHLQISAIDDNGNESTENLYYNILVEEAAPTPDVTPPTLSVTIVEPIIARGSTFQAEVSISDNEILAGSELTVIYKKPDNTDLTTVVYTTELNTQTTSTVLTVTLPIEATFDTGMYSVTFVILDAAGNRVSKQQVFSVN